MEELLSYRDAIEKTLNQLYLMLRREYSGQVWAEDALERLFAFSTKGKLLRGALVIQGAKMVGKEIDNDVLTTAGIMELVQSALLIHDDIMDQDSLRRGSPSLHHQYELFAQAAQRKNSEVLGRGMGMCVGDIVFFLVFHVLTRLKTEHTLYLTDILSRELIIVGFGQMQDIWPLSTTTSEDIINLYKYKTGRYSFSLPLLLGVGLSGKGKAFEKNLIEFGEAIGPLFQIADDRLGLYGTEAEIGKPIGSDIKEGKVTLYWQMLLERVTSDEMKFLKELQGTSVSPASLLQLQKLLEVHHVAGDIQKIEYDLLDKAKKSITALEISDEDKRVLLEVVAFVTARKK